MENREPGEVFLDNLLIGVSDVPEIDENHDVPDEEDFEDDGSQFTTQTVEDITATDIYGNLGGPPIDEDASEVESQIDEPTQNLRNPPKKRYLPKLHSIFRRRVGNLRVDESSDTHYITAP